MASATVLIVGSFFPSLYYAFYCHAHLQFFYLSGICLCGLGKLHIKQFTEFMIKDPYVSCNSRCLHCPFPGILETLASGRTHEGLHRSRRFGGHTGDACTYDSRHALATNGVRLQLGDPFGCFVYWRCSALVSPTSINTSNHSSP